MPFVTLEWLGDHVELEDGLSVEGLAEALVKVGLEEEQILPPAVSGPLVVGKVLTLEAKQHSNGKVINYCRVDVGAFNDEPGQGKEPSDVPSRGIICGAHNFGVGDHVVVALPGAVLPGGFEIAARKTYGHISDGMLCSFLELGLPGDSSGIILLDDFLGSSVPAPGTDLKSRLGLDTEVLEINVTPDRGYCFSMRGVAREYSHSTGAKFKDPGLVGNLVSSVPAVTDDAFAVKLNDQSPIRGNDGCDRFVTRIVQGIDPGAQTPQWMVDRLQSAGMRSISLIVDVTNYVMLDLGQPMHAYDLDAVVEPIVVRRAAAGESLVTLDDVKRDLDPQDLLITDSPYGESSRILGLAGVMGGAYGEVSPSTTAVVLEAAHFDPVSVARSSRRHRLSSEAAKRFERGVDPQLAPVAAQRAADLLVKYGGGVISPRVGDVDNTLESPSIQMDWSFPSQVIGVDYTCDEVASSLEAIGCEVSGETAILRVKVPSWRSDLRQPADLVEEVARLRGYDQIPGILPTIPLTSDLENKFSQRRLVANTLASKGLTQVLTYPFVGDQRGALGYAEDDPRWQAVRLRNPIADDAPFLRREVLETLLPVAALNVSRGNGSLAVFEIGKVFEPAGTPRSEMPQDFAPSAEQISSLQAQVPNQPTHLGALFCGTSAPQMPGSFARDFDWADPVRMVQVLGDALGVKLVVAKPYLQSEDSSFVNARALQAQGLEPLEESRLAPFHPGRVAQIRLRVGKKLQVVGYAGELHPRVCEALRLPVRSAGAELNLSAVFDQISTTPYQAQRVSTYPPAKEDVAFVVSQQVPAADLLTEIRKAAGDVLEDVRLFDIYESESLGEGNRSLAFALQLRGQDQTLTAQQLGAVRDRVVKAVEKRFGAKLRA